MPFSTWLRALAGKSTPDNPRADEPVRLFIRRLEDRRVLSAAPVVTLPLATINYTEMNPAIVLEPNATVSDSDSPNFNGGNLTISFTANGAAEDRLSIKNNGLGVGTIGTSGSNVTYSGVTIGTFSGGNNGSTPLVITFSSNLASVAAVQELARNILYSNVSDNPSTAARTVQFVATDAAAGNSSTPVSEQLTITPVNDKPVVNVSAAVASYTENAAATVLDNTIAVTDPDNTTLASATVSITANFAVGEDVLAATTTGTSIVASYNATTGVLTLSGSDTMANYQQVLRTVTYANSSENPSSAQRTVSISVNDGTDDSDVVTKRVSVTPVNDAAVVMATSTPVSYTENDPATVLDSALTVTDVDNASLAGGTVSITGNYASGQDVLAGTTTGTSITASFSAANGILTLTGSDTLAHYQQVLRTVTYFNSSDNPSTLQRSISFVVNDGTVNSAAAVVLVNVTATNDAPILSATAAVVNYTENDAATTLDNTILVSDPDNASLASATASITANFQSGADVLSADTTGTSITASYAAGTGILTLTGSDTIAHYQQVLRTVSYFNSSDNPTSLQRSITLTVSDGTANSNSIVETVNVTAVNDAPMVTVSAGAVSYTENAAATQLDGTLTVADADNANLASAQVAITTNFASGQDVLAATTTGTSITASYSVGTGVLTLTGADTVAHYQQVLRTVTYFNSSDNPSGLARTVTFTANDGSVDSSTVSKQVNVMPVNDPPNLTLTSGNVGYSSGDQPTLIDATATLTDVDSPAFNSGSLVVSITSPASTPDTLAISNQGNGAGQIGISGSNVTYGGVVFGTFTGGTSNTPLTITFTNDGNATVAAVEALVQSITYSTPPFAGGSHPNRTVHFVVNDGAGGSDSGNKTVQLFNRNNKPIVSAPAAIVSYTENDPPTLIHPGATVSDIDTPIFDNGRLTVTQSTGGSTSDRLAIQNQGAGAGQISVSGNTVSYEGTAFGTFSGGNTPASPLIITFFGDGTASQAAVQSLIRAVTFENVSDNPTTANRVVQFQLNDGEAVNPGNSTIVSATITVTAVNDPPTITVSAAHVAYTENAAATVLDNTLTVTDPDDTNLNSARVAITGNFASGEDILAASTTGTSITASYNGGTGVLTLSGVDTVAHYQQVLRTVTYRNSSDNPSGLQRTVSITANDGSVNSAVQTKLVDVTPVNDPPVVVSVAGPLTFTEKDAPKTIAPAITVSDVDNTTLAGGQVAISNNFAGAEDVLAVDVTGTNITASYDTNTGVLSLTGADTVANYQLVLSRVTYQNTSLNPSNLQRTVSFTVNDGTANSTAATRLITVVPVNDPPMLTTSGVTLNYTENDPATVIDAGVTVSDVDNATLNHADVKITNNFAAGQDVLAANTAGTNITATYNAGTGVLHLAGVDTLADYQAVLDSVTYRNSSDNPSGATRTVQYTVNDGAVDSNIGTATIAVTPVNDPPLITTTPGALTFTEKDTPKVVDSGLTVVDPDSPLLASGTVAISGNYAPGEDFLNANTTGTSITATFDPFSGVLSLSGSDTVAHYQQVLRSVTYVNTSLNPSTATRTVTFVVNDFQVNGPPATKDITVISVDDAPQVTTANSTLAYTEQQPPAPVDTTVSISDVDNNTATSASVSITNNFAVGQDVLMANTAGTNITATYNPLTGVLSLTGVDSLANYEQVLRSVLYSNTSLDPSAAKRTLTYIVSDGQKDSAPQVNYVTVTPVNNPPMLTMTPGGIVFTENQSPATVDGGLQLADADNITAASAQVAIVSGFTAGEDVLTFSTTGTLIVGNYNAGTGVLTLTGVDTLAHYQQVLRSVKYGNASDFPSTAQRVLAFTVNDGALTGALDSPPGFRTVDVISVNDAPVLHVPGTQTILEDTPLVFSTAGGNALTVSDVDLGAGMLQVTLQSPDGTLTLASVNGLTFAFGNGVANTQMQFTGTLANVRAALEGMTFQPGPNFNGATNVNISISDGGSSGIGGPLSASGVIPIQITAVADTPLLTGPNLVVGNEADTIVLTLAPMLTDPNERLDITVSNVPASVVLVDSNGVAHSGSTSYTFTPSRAVQLGQQPLQITMRSTFPLGSALSIVARSTELSNGDFRTSAALPVQMTFNNVPPTLTVMASPIVASISTIQLSMFDPGSLPLTYTIDFGDGNVTRGVVPGGSQQSITPIQHIFLKAPANSTAFAIIATVSDGITTVQTRFDLPIPQSGLGIFKAEAARLTEFIEAANAPQTPPAKNSSAAAESNQGFELPAQGNDNVSSDERTVVLRLVSPLGREAQNIELPDNVLENLPGFFKNLPDGHYRVYLIQSRTERLVIDVFVRQGRPTEPDQAMDDNSAEATLVENQDSPAEQTPATPVGTISTAERETTAIPPAAGQSSRSAQSNPGHFTLPGATAQGTSIQRTDRIWESWGRDYQVPRKIETAAGKDN